LYHCLHCEGPEYLQQKFDISKSAVFLGCMFACYPLGLVMHLLPYGNIRHAFSFVMGTILLQLCWGIHWIHTPVTSLIVYAMLKLTPRNKVQQVVPTFVMFYQAVAHFQHQYSVNDYLGLDVYFTCSQMILTQKLYMLAYNLVRMQHQVTMSRPEEESQQLTRFPHYFSICSMTDTC
jgi:hypothetical protein